MVTIKIILLGTQFFLPCFTHIAAVITDVETGRQYLMNHPFGSYGEGDPRAQRTDKAMQLYQRSRSSICLNTICLGSERYYDDFLDYVRDIEAKRNFAWFSSNCANAIDEMLDFFFPESNVSKLKLYFLLLALPLAVFPPSILMGMLNCLLDYTSIKTPAGVFHKACILSWNNDYSVPASVMLSNSRDQQLGAATCDEDEEMKDEVMMRLMKI